MYPDIYHLLHDLFGLDLPGLSLLKTFGFLVAIGFFVATWLLRSELKRKQFEDQLGFELKEVVLGNPPSGWDYGISAIIGFLVGYKFIAMFMNWQDATNDPLQFLMSSQGALLPGILTAVAAVGLRYYEYRQEAHKGVRTVKQKTYAYMRVGDIVVRAALFGFIGAKIFNALETWDDFVQDPLGSLFSSSGLTFYGGLIMATLFLWWYSRKINLDFRHLCDAAAPALMLAYGIGRLGCQVSGDGDWGIHNSAYITDTMTYKVVPIDSDGFQRVLLEHPEYAERLSDQEIRHASFKAPDGWPVWFFAYNYPQNVNKVGIIRRDCDPHQPLNYCTVLPLPVFPTPVYEFLASVLIFCILWLLRKRIHVPLGLFSIYLVFNGIERYLVEQIRVNYQYHWGSLVITQAELIALLMIVAGIVLWVLKNQIHDRIAKQSDTSEIVSE